jgi:Bacterial mobilisation protein (MobC)
MSADKMARLRATYAGERRTSHFGFQLTPSERVDLERRAEDRGMVLAEFVRACCLLNHGAGEAPGSRPRLPEATALLGELGRVGNNLNQLARHANMSGSLPEETLLRDAITELKATLGRIV